MQFVTAEFENFLLLFWLAVYVVQAQYYFYNAHLIMAMIIVRPKNSSNN